MKTLIRATAGLLLVIAGASGSTIFCGDQTNDANGVGGNTLDLYVSLSSGCYIGNVLFSNFTYSYSLGVDGAYVSGLQGTGTQVLASGVQVIVNTQTDALTFKGNWVVDHYQTANLSLAFSVTAPPATQILSITNVYTGGPAGNQNGGPVYTPSAVCTLGTCGPTTFTNQTKTIAMTQGPITLTNTVVMNSNGSTSNSPNNVHLSLVTDQLGIIPEPVTIGMMLTGLGALALLRRRKQA